MAAAEEWETGVLDGAVALLGPVLPGVLLVTDWMPPEPDRVAVLSLRTMQDDAGEGTDLLLSLQVRCRGAANDRADVRDMADALREQLHLRARFPLGPARVSLMWRQGHGMMGRDTAGRWETSSNYYFHTARPAPAETYR